MVKVSARRLQRLVLSRGGGRLGTVVMVHKAPSLGEPLAGPSEVGRSGASRNRSVDSITGSASSEVQTEVRLCAQEPTAIGL